MRQKRSWSSPLNQGLVFSLVPRLLADRSPRGSHPATNWLMTPISSVARPPKDSSLPRQPPTIKGLSHECTPVVVPTLLKYFCGPRTVPNSFRWQLRYPPHAHFHDEPMNAPPPCWQTGDPLPPSIDQQIDLTSTDFWETCLLRTHSVFFRMTLSPLTPEIFQRRTTRMHS